MGGVRIRTCSSCKSIFNDWPMRTILSEDSSYREGIKKLALLMDWAHERREGGRRQFKGPLSLFKNRVLCLSAPVSS